MANKIEMIVKYYVQKALREELEVFEQVIEEKVREKVALVQTLNEIETRKRKPLPEGRKSLFDVVDVDAGPVEQQLPREASPPSASRPKITPEALGITEGIWADIYKDTASSNNPLLSEQRGPGNMPPSGGGENPELVSEEQLRSLGVFKDYSHHVDAMERKDKQKSGDADLEARRKEILSKTIQR